MNTPHNQRSQKSSDSGAIFYRKIGWVLFSFALVLIGITYTLNKLTIETMGTVVSSTLRNTTLAGSYQSGATVFLPVFRFVDNKDITREVPIQFEDSESSYEIGKELMIGYDPDDFSSIRITSWEAHWGFPTLFIGLSLFFFWAARTLEKQHNKD